MDNFRRPRRPARSAGVDGIIGGRRPMAGRSTNGSTRPQAYRPAAARQAASAGVGNFRQADGFHAARQPALATPVAAPASVGATAGIPWPGQAREAAPPTKKQGRKARRADKKLQKQQKRANLPRWRKIIKRGSLVTVALLVIGGGFMGVNALMKARKVLKGGGGAAALQKFVDPTKLKGEGDGRINIMVLGKGGPGHDGPDLTDTIMVASIDPVHKDAALLSIPRDLWVKVPGDGSSKINSVYPNAKYAITGKRKYNGQAADAEKAGIGAIKSTVESTMGIPLHYYVMVDFEAFRSAVDTVGGVDVNVKEQLYDPTVAWENNRNPLIAGVGPNHFDGKKALLYARSRHGSARGDFDRASRQREIILALKEKVLSIGTFGNPVKISQLVNAFGDHVQSDFSVDEIRRLYDLAKDIPGSKVTSVGLADEPNVLVTTGNVNGQSVVIPKAGVGNYSAIQSFVRNTLRDSYLRQENASIAVLNGTETAGLATAKADDLKSFGYNVIQVADSPVKGNQQTILVALRGDAKKYTQSYLEKRLKVKATSQLPAGVTPGTADFVVILGQNDAAAAGQ